MHVNEYVVVLATAILGAFVLLPYGDAQQKAVALGALVGLVGGHLNGRAGRTPSSSPG